VNFVISTFKSIEEIKTILFQVLGAKKDLNILNNKIYQTWVISHS